MKVIKNYLGKLKHIKQISCKTCNNYNITLKSYIMKKLIITAVLLLTLLTIQAQQQFQGMWVCNESSYVTTILTSKSKIVKAFSFSFDENDVLEENIIYYDRNSLVTSIHNKENGWKVTMDYEYIDSNTLHCTFTGDHTGLVIMTRLK